MPSRRWVSPLPEEKASNDEPGHKGLLRIDTVLLRKILGLDDSLDAESTGDSTLKPTPNSAREAAYEKISEEVRKLYLGRTLPDCAIKDVVLAAIDVESPDGYKEIASRYRLLLGVSTIDTRDIRSLRAESLGQLSSPTSAVQLDHEAVTETSVIKSRQFQVAKHKPYRERSDNFLFGSSEKVSLTELKERLELLFRDREFVIVTHGGKQDLQVIDLLKLEARALCNIDTMSALQFPFRAVFRWSLEELLEQTGITWAKLHVAGNDAHYTIRALLMIAVKDWERRGNVSTPEDIQATLSVIENIAKARLPPGRAETWVRGSVQGPTLPKIEEVEMEEQPDEETALEERAEYQRYVDEELRDGKIERIKQMKEDCDQETQNTEFWLHDYE